MTLSMKYTNIQFTEHHEGYQNKAYRDSGGVWTCGYGHTKNVGPSTVCTPELAETWLEEDIQDAVNAVNNLVEIDLTQNEFDALVDFTFNVGVTAFKNSTMLLLLNQNKISDAADQFERWDLCKGVVVAGLLNRRKDEEALFNTPNSMDSNSDDPNPITSQIVNAADTVQNAIQSIEDAISEVKDEDQN